MKGPITPRSLEMRLDLGAEVIRDIWVDRGQDRPVGPLSKRVGNRVMFVTSSTTNLDDVLQKMADKTSDTICVSSFLIQEGRFTDAMLRAVRRGVRSYILTAREEELKMSPEELGEKKGEAIEGHKRLLDAFAGKVLVRTAPHFHAKFVLFDPLGKEPRGVLATCNLTQGAMAGSNIEIAMTLTEAEIRSLFVQFLQGFWNESHHELIRKDGRLHELTRGGFEGKVPVGEIAHPCTHSGVNGIRDMAIDLITGAKRELVFGAWSFDADHRVLKEAQAALDRGVKVKILARPTRENTLALSALSTNGATVVGFHKLFHAKFLMTESGGLLSSANWTKRGLDEGFEAGMALKSADAAAARELIDGLLASGGLELRGSTSIKDIPNGRHFQRHKESKELVSITIDEGPEMNKKTEKVDIEALSQPEISRPSPSSPNKEGSQRLFREVIESYELSPIGLPDGDMTIVKENDGLIIVRDKGGRRYVPIDRWELLDRAILLAKEEKARIVYATVQRIDGLKTQERSRA